MGSQLLVGSDLKERVVIILTIGTLLFIVGVHLLLLSAAGGSIKHLVAWDVVDLLVPTFGELGCYLVAHLDGATCSSWVSYINHGAVKGQWEELFGFDVGLYCCSKRCL